MKDQAEADRKRDYLLVGLLAAVGLGLRLYRLGDQSLWLDEGFTWYRAMLPFDQGLKALRQVFTHPPLFHLLSSAWVRIGSSEWMLRLPEALVGTVTIPVIYAFGRRLEGRSLGLLSALLLTVNPFHVWYSRDARDYTLVMLLTLLVLSSFWRLLRHEHTWIRFTVYSSLLYITHYFGLLSALTQFIYLVFHLRRRRLLFRRWVAVQAIAFLPLGFWLVTLFAQETQAIGIGWIPRPEIWAPLVTLWNFVGLYSTSLTALTVVTLLVFAWALMLGLYSKKRWLGLLLLWLVVPPIFMILVSWSTGRNLYVDRYFIGGLPALLIISSWGILVATHKRRAAGYVLAVLLTATSLLNSIRIYNTAELRKVDWRGAIQYIQDTASPASLVILPSLESYAIMAYYEQGLIWDYLSSYIEEKSLDSITKDQSEVWLILDNPQSSNHLVTNSAPFEALQEGDPVTVRWLTEHRSAISDRRDFAGLTVLRIQAEP
jgi:uncharacterized membrane protein